MASDSLPSARLGRADDDPERTVLASPPAALRADARLAEYALRSVIGQGGFGIVYRAWDPQLECLFAIKEYMPSSIALRCADGRVALRSPADRAVFDMGLRSFVNEAHLLAGFDHPALVKVYRFWEANGTAYMLMPHYDGPTLKELLEAAPGPIEEAWLRALLAPLTDALRVLHARHCCHRDIAPDNIKLRSDTGAPVLLDFGAARHVIEGARRELTAIYKPGYAPLEQREDSGLPQGPWTDIYALAAVLHRAIAGDLPPSPLARLQADPYVPLARRFGSRYDGAFLAAIDRALAVRPDARTRSIDQFRAELGLDDARENASTTLAWTAGARPPARPPQSASPRRRRVVLALAGVSIAAIAIPAWQRRTASPGSPQPAAPASGATARAPVAAPAPAPAPVLAPVPQDVFGRVLAGRAPGHAVGLQARRTRLQVDRDALELTVTSSRDGYVQVLLLDADGSLVLLYPNAATRVLKVRRDEPLALPRLIARAPTGHVRLLAIISGRPRAFGPPGGHAEIFERLGPASEAVAGAVPPRPGGIGCQRGEPCADDYGAAALDLDVVPG